VWLTIRHHQEKESVVAKLEESGKSCFHLGPVKRPTFPLKKNAQPCVKSRLRLSDFYPPPSTSQNGNRASTLGAAKCFWAESINVFPRAGPMAAKDNLNFNASDAHSSNGVNISSSRRKRHSLWQPDPPFCLRVRARTWPKNEFAHGHQEQWPVFERIDNALLDAETSISNACHA
jgi:hypothetical protein